LIDQRAEHFSRDQRRTSTKGGLHDEKRNPNNSDIDFVPPVAIVVIIGYA
jgi:hypothetical protein